MTGHKGGGDLTDCQRLVEAQRTLNEDLIERVQGLNDVARRLNAEWMERVRARSDDALSERAFGLSAITGKVLHGGHVGMECLGNAKARRRWRRKNLPNAHREEAKRVAEWGRELRAKAEHNGDWTWAPGIWAGVPPSSPRPTSNTAAQLMVSVETADGAMERAVGEWEGQTDGELAREVASLINGEVVP